MEEWIDIDKAMVVMVGCKVSDDETVYNTFNVSYLDKKKQHTALWGGIRGKVKKVKQNRGKR